MLKRITSLLLAVVILIGVASTGTYFASAASDWRTSDECVRILKLEEGFSKKPYWDYTQYTVGYGTRCPDDMVDYYLENGITEEEAEVLLRNFLTAIERDLNKKIVDNYQLNLTQNQFDALVLFSYNCGTGWTYETDGTFHNAIKNRATGNDLIRAFALWCSAGGEIKTFLLRRRLSEANMYLNGIYDQTPPENYCYVLYDANGGSTSPRSQGYDSNLTAAPYPVPTYDGYSFDGWYTQKSGGTKVTALDASHNGTTLYAHWVDPNGETPSGKPVSLTVTVTATDVNLREGPGTNYARIGSANKGDQYTITEVASGSGYQWGKFDGGWICLQYTNYDEVVSEVPEEPTEPETTPTEPPATEPPATEPPATEPPATEAPTEPEESNKLMGTINVNEWLRVRSGPGTGYSVVEYLHPKDRVEILERKTVGSMVWARIANGWISMDYVILDQGSSSGGAQPSGAVTGVITNCSQLRIRSGPSTQYSIVGYLDGGTTVTITDRTTTGSMVWGKISDGWISMDYVSLNSGSSQSSETVYGYCNVEEWLRIRTGPGTSYAVAGYMKPQERVEITERRTVGNTVWGKTSKGWISMDYVILESQGSGSSSQSTTETKTIVADLLRVRREPGTSHYVVDFLYYGTKVEILETTVVDGTTWGRISNGWISMDYAK